MPLSVEIPFEIPPPACRQPPFPEASAHVNSSDPLLLRPIARVPPRGAALPQLLHRGASGGLSPHPPRVCIPRVRRIRQWGALGRAKGMRWQHGGTKMPFVCPICSQLKGKIGNPIDPFFSF
jgi:hypothetical protein